MKRLIPAVKAVLMAVATLLFVVSCEKRPNSNFRVENQEIHPGDTLTIKNNSTNAQSYNWKIGGKTSTDFEPKYVVENSAVQTGLTIGLEAVNKRKRDFKEVKYDVVEGNGTAMFYFFLDSTNNWSGDIPVYVDSTLVGTITRYTRKELQCGSSFGLNIPLKSGEHSYKCYGFTPQYGTFSVGNNGCVVIQVK